MKYLVFGHRLISHVINVFGPSGFKFVILCYNALLFTIYEICKPIISYKYQKGQESNPFSCVILLDIENK